MAVLIAMPRRAPSICALLALLALPPAALAADPPPPPDLDLAPKAPPPADAAAPPAAPEAPVKKPRARVVSPSPEPTFDLSTLEAQRLPPYAPAVLMYEDGMPIPPGYRLVTRRRRSLMAAGAALFGASYLAAVLTAGTVVAGYDKHRGEVAPLFVPFGGPFITLVTSRDAQLNDPDRRTNGVLCILDGAAQITGAALFVAGLVTREPILMRTQESYRTDNEARVMPELFVSGRSVTLRWQF